MARKDFDLLGSKITNLAAPSNDSDATNKKYVDNHNTAFKEFLERVTMQDSGMSIKANITDTDPATLELHQTNGYLISGGVPKFRWGTNYVIFDEEINANNNKIINVETPTDDKDATNKKYVDDNVKDSNALAAKFVVYKDYIIMKAGNYAPGLGYPAIIKLSGGTGSLTNDSTDMLQWTGTGVKILSNLSMVDNKITNVGAPTDDKDAATKKYVDDNAGTTPTREVLVDSSYSISSSSNYRFNLTDDLGKYKNIQIIVDPNSYKFSVILDTIFEINFSHTVYTYSYDDTNPSRNFYISYNPSWGYVTVRNDALATYTFDVKITGERI